MPHGLPSLCDGSLKHMAAYLLLCLDASAQSPPSHQTLIGDPVCLPLCAGVCVCVCGCVCAGVCVFLLFIKDLTVVLAACT